MRARVGRHRTQLCCRPPGLNIVYVGGLGGHDEYCHRASKKSIIIVQVNTFFRRGMSDSTPFQDGGLEQRSGVELTAIASHSDSCKGGSVRVGRCRLL